MEKLFLNIQSMSQKKVEIGILLFIVFESMWIFPLKYEFSLINVVFIYCFFMVGFVLCAVTVRKPAIILLSILFSNLLGLALRIWLEWGEVTIMEALTPKSVILTYVPVIIITYIGYVYTKMSIKNKQ